MADTAVAEVRSFNRFMTERIGLLDEGLLHTSYTLTEARILFELGQVPTTEVVRLRNDLGLDPGYLSRILGRFEAAGLVVRRRADTDARRQVVALTDHGRSVFATLDKRSTEEVDAMLSPLDGAGRFALLSAISTIRDLLSPTTDRPRPAVTLRRPQVGDLGWVVQRHGELYAREYGWDESFEALVARIVTDFAEHHDATREAAWVAEAAGERVGFILCVRREDETAQLRLLLVEPTARGMGVGTLLVDECLRFATSAGYERIMLWTNSVLDSARRIYERAGFQLVEEEPHHSFGVDLVGQVWQRPLASQLSS